MKIDINDILKVELNHAERIWPKLESGSIREYSNAEMKIWGPKAKVRELLKLIK